MLEISARGIGSDGGGSASVDVTRDFLERSRAWGLRGVDHVAVLVENIEDVLPDFVNRLRLDVVSDETLADPAVRLVQLDAGNVDIQLAQPCGPGRLADDLQSNGPGLHHVCFGVPALGAALAGLQESSGSIFRGGQGRRACFLSHRPGQLYIELIEFGDGEAYGTLATATWRVLSYWAAQCCRDIGRLVEHFAENADLITPDGHFAGRAAIESLYKKSFAAYPQLSAEIKARYAGRGTHGFEFTAMLTSADRCEWKVQGVNIVTVENGFISRLRSYEDPPSLVSPSPLRRSRPAAIGG